MAVLVGNQAPFFAGEKTFSAVLGDGQIVDNYSFRQATEGKYAVVFFYPLDFTFVCPSELIALDNRMADFKARNVEVIAVSIHSHFKKILLTVAFGYLQIEVEVYRIACGECNGLGNGTCLNSSRETTEPRPKVS